MAEDMLTILDVEEAININLDELLPLCDRLNTVVESLKANILTALLNEFIPFICKFGMIIMI
ncbi:hypothetical protein [Iningainema tapete]|uniref:Uncharacterized protein n=1 Tax=Iningainema tapete BLCC-T55 TaxID=2748662 RepID=A0A8J6XQ39_9CYAN|nr:hypothetical protein [Iningainema tapete]MBD2777432.1 hypothetical protein [Iningainema tapete BLCC-T55]